MKIIKVKQPIPDVPPFQPYDLVIKVTCEMDENRLDELLTIAETSRSELARKVADEFRVAI